jgi:hypothetical protein
VNGLLFRWRYACVKSLTLSMIIEWCARQVKSTAIDPHGRGPSSSGISGIVRVAASARSPGKTQINPCLTCTGYDAILIRGKVCPNMSWSIWVQRPSPSYIQPWYAHVRVQSPTTPSDSFNCRWAHRFSRACNEPSLPLKTAIERPQNDTSITCPGFTRRSHSTGYQ